MPIHQFPPAPRPSSSSPHTNGHSTDTLEGDTSDTVRYASASKDLAPTATLPRSRSQRSCGDGYGSDMAVDDSDMESEAEDERVVVHVEVRLNRRLTCMPQRIQTNMQGFVNQLEGRIALGAVLEGWEESMVLGPNIDRVWVEEGLMGESSVDLQEAIIQVHVYQPTIDDTIEDFTADLDDDDDEQKVSAASVKALPSTELDGVWDTLVYADDIKARLLNYINSTILFSESEVDFNVIAWNRVILLHGPPGTGKTSLCRALAQKISVRLHDTYSRGKLIEINSHSLFSKWFSESGKLVQRLFDTVTSEVDDEGQFVVVMIDEVESLTAARAGAMRGNEPSDSLRVVNALLTQLDKLRTRKNVLVMTTSNLADAIDEAFISRVDLQEYVPLPPPQAVYSILQGCLKEMMSKGLVRTSSVPHWRAVEQYAESWGKEKEKFKRVGGALAALAIRCHALELSGRTLRKLPVLAHARYLFNSSGEHRTHRIEKWIEAMNFIVDIEASKKAQEEQRLKVREGQYGHHVVGDDTVSTSNGHRRGASLERSEVGRLVATKVSGEDHQHHHH